MVALPRSHGPAFGGVSLTRTLDAPRALVFRAWTEPMQLARWWGPHGSAAQGWQHEPRPGGRLRYVLRTADGVRICVSGVYEAFTPPVRLVATHEGAAEFGAARYAVRNSLLLAEQGARTTLMLQSVVLHAAPGAAPMLDGLDGAWRDSLERLETYVATRRGTGD
jgi:uncharacterized protein YndB with AHSA1/START domain